MDKAHIGKVLGELEADVMHIIWQSPTAASVRFVTETLQKKRKIAYTTVMTIMNRLVEKGLLKRKSQGKAYTYQAVYSKNRLLTKVSRQIIKNLVDTFGESAVAHFADKIEQTQPKTKTKLLHILRKVQKDDSQ